MLEKRLGKKLPPSVIFNAPTIDQLAGILEQEMPAVRESSLVKVQDAGSDRPPLFCIPGNLGNVFTDLRHLTRHLGQDQVVYGLQDNIHHPSRIVTLAEHYIDDISGVQPEGPYLLTGICSGGVIAFEMAQQLLRKGQDVLLLALVEPASLPLPGARSYFNLTNEIWTRFAQRSRQHSRNVYQLSSFENLMYMRMKMKLVSNLWALKRYFPRSYSGLIHLFLTKESLVHSPRLGWRDLALGGAEIHEIPGNHRTITGDNALIDEIAMKVLAEKLRVCIDTVLRDDNRIQSFPTMDYNLSKKRA